MVVQNFEDLIVWQKARELTRAIYRLTRVVPFAKDFGLVDQIRRAAVSIGSNIAEGFDRGSKNEFVTFLGYAKGSTAEVRSQLYTALDAQYISQEDFDDLKEQNLSIGRMLSFLITKIKASKNKGTRTT